MTTRMSDLDAWLAQGAALRPQLEAEREELLARLATVDAALAALSGAAAPPPKPSRRQAIRDILAAHPEGVKAGDILRMLKEIEPDVNAHKVYNTVFRLVDAGDIRSVGPRGNQMYVLTARKGSEEPPASSKIRHISGGLFPMK